MGLRSPARRAVPKPDRDRRIALQCAPEIFPLPIADASRSDDDLAATDGPADARQRRRILAQAADHQRLVAERQPAKGEGGEQMDVRKPAPAAQMPGDLVEAILLRAEENEVGLLVARDDLGGNVPGARVDE